MLGDILLMVRADGTLDNATYYFCISNERAIKITPSSRRNPEIVRLRRVDMRRASFLRYEGANAEWRAHLKYFLDYHKYDPRVIALILRALSGDPPFSSTFLAELPLLYPNLSELSSGSYDEKWDILLSRAMPGDLLFTVRPHNLVSSIICTVTHGPWSHVGAVVGKDLLMEMVTSGVVRRPVSVYRDGSTRVGLYKPSPPLSGAQVEGIQAALRLAADSGFRYGYSAALATGLLNLFGYSSADTVPSPNDIALGGHLFLDCYV